MTLLLALAAWDVFNVLRFAVIVAMAFGAWWSGRPGHQVERS